MVRSCSCRISLNGFCCAEDAVALLLAPTIMCEDILARKVGLSLWCGQRQTKPELEEDFFSPFTVF